MLFTQIFRSTKFPSPPHLSTRLIHIPATPPTLVHPPSQINTANTANTNPVKPDAPASCLCAAPWNVASGTGDIVIIIVEFVFVVIAPVPVPIIIILLLDIFDELVNIALKLEIVAVLLIIDTDMLELIIIPTFAAAAWYARSVIFEYLCSFTTIDIPA